MRHMTGRRLTSLGELPLVQNATYCYLDNNIKYGGKWANKTYGPFPPLSLLFPHLQIALTATPISTPPVLLKPISIYQSHISTLFILSLNIPIYPSLKNRTQVYHDLMTCLRGKYYILIKFRFALIILNCQFQSMALLIISKTNYIFYVALYIYIQ